VQRLQQWWSPEAAPTLTALKYDVCCRRHGFNCTCAALDWSSLSNVRSLTELGLGWSRERSALSLLRAVNTDAMPLLRRLVLGGHLTAPAVGDEEHEAVALLQRAPFTALYVENTPGIGSLLHHLPQLRELTYKTDRLSIAEAIVLAPQLRKLVLLCGMREPLLVSLLQQFWRRMGCPPLQTGGRVDEDEWQKHFDFLDPELLQPVQGSVCAASPLLRELVVHRNIESLPAVAFPYLTLLPHLRVLDCALRTKDLLALGLLPQLEELRLRSADGDEPIGHWSDVVLYTLGVVPLARLYTLRLCNDDETHCECKKNRETLRAADPDFPWGGIDDNWRRWIRVVQTDVTLNGLRSLLQLPALTALDLPWIKDSVLEQFRQLAQQQGRAALRIDRPVPLSRRSRLERHWLSVDQLGADD